VKLRKAKLSDLNQIIALNEACYSDALRKTRRRFNRAHVERQVKKAIARDAAFVLENERDVIGFAWGRKTLDYFGNAYAEIVLLMVRRDFQGKGYGTKLIKFLEEKLGAKDVRILVLEASPAKNFTES
jgi:ribosomal protein S18 acetylase RimI-like enzyme